MTVAWRTFALVLVLAAGCTLYDGRPDLQLTLHASRVRDQLDLTVEAGSGKRAQLLVDGEELGPELDAGKRMLVVLEGLPAGVHRVRARLADVPYAVDSDEFPFVVDREGPTFAELDPPGGIYPLWGTRTVVVRVTDEAGVERVAVGGRSPPRVTVERLDDDRWRITALEPLERDLAVQLDAVDGVGNGSALELVWTRAPPGCWLGELSRPIGGTRRFDLRGCPAGEVELHVDDVLVATGTAGPYAAGVELDTRPHADGTHVLELRHAGLTQADRRAAVFDNTRPHILGCAADPASGGAASVRGVVFPTGDEPVRFSGAGPIVTAGGVAVPVWHDAEKWCIDGPVPVPGTLSLVLPAANVVDLAGNPAVEDGACELDMPMWAAPGGTAPLARDGSPLVATSADAETYHSTRTPWSRSSCGPGISVVAWVDAVSGAGKTASWGREYLATFRVDPDATVTELLPIANWGVWIERGADGIGRVYHGPSLTVLNADRARDARGLARDRHTRAVAWSEANAAGGRSLAFTNMIQPSPVTTWTSSAASILDEVAIGGGAVAYVEHGPGGGRHLRWKRRVAETLVDVGPAAANADPARPASSPAVHPAADELAWAEDGQVFRRIGATGAPVLVNADPGAPARLPRFAAGQGRTWLAFVQETATGDEIRVWVNGAGESPRLLAHPVNAGAAGLVSTFEISGGEASNGPLPVTITWTDPDGNVRIRVYNE